MLLTRLSDEAADYTAQREALRLAEIELMRHRERVAALRTQTHGDFIHADARIYRTKLRALGGCPKTQR